MDVYGGGCGVMGLGCGVMLEMVEERGEERDGWMGFGKGVGE